MKQEDGKLLLTCQQAESNARAHMFSMFKFKQYSSIRKEEQIAQDINRQWWAGEMARWLRTLEARLSFQLPQGGSQPSVIWRPLLAGTGAACTCCQE